MINIAIIITISNFIVFGLTQQELESKILRILGGTIIPPMW